MTEIKTIFWVSQLNNLHSRQAYLSSKILPYIKEKFNVVIFTPERLKPSETVLYSNDNVNSIFRLPEYCRVNKDYIIIYNIEDSSSSQLVTYFLKQYLGLIILHDISLFKLEISKFSHGSVETEINDIMKKRYGLNAPSIGNEMVLNRSLEIYGYLYDFIDEILAANCEVVVFSNDAKEYISKKACTPSYIIKPAKNSMTYRKKEKNLDFNVLFEIRSYLSKLGQDLFRLLNGNSNQSTLVVNIHWDGIKIISKVVQHDALNSVDQFLKKNDIHYVIEVGNSPLMGLGAYTLAALDMGISVLLEESFETRMMGLDKQSLYEKSTSLAEILDLAYAQCNSDKNIQSFNYNSLSESIISVVNKSWIDLKRKNEEKLKIRSHVLMSFKNLFLDSITANSNFNLPNSDSYLEVLDQSISDLLDPHY